MKSLFLHLTASTEERVMGNLNERLDKLKALMEDPEFLEGKGLSNEVNIRIFTYDPKDEMTVRYFIKQLMADTSLNCHIKEFNLYRIFLSICDDKRITDRIPALEKKKGKDYLLKQLTAMATNKMYLQKMVYGPHKMGDVILIDGVGEVFPFLRVHSLLESMQAPFSDVPVVVIYPGTFDGRSLKLFDILQPNSYYRAFKTI